LPSRGSAVGCFCQPSKFVFFQYVGISAFSGYYDTPPASVMCPGNIIVQITLLEPT
jgi:hypothetical protein